MRSRTLLTVLCTLLVLSVSVAGMSVEVKVDPGTDFTLYRTYEWTDGTPAAKAQVQEWIVEAVDRELAAKGLRRVARGYGADLQVVTHAVASIEASIGGNYVTSPTAQIGILSVNVNMVAVGTLMIDLVERASEKHVWRGVASDALGQYPKPKKIRKKVDAVTRKLFAQYPPS